MRRDAVNHTSRRIGVWTLTEFLVGLAAVVVGIAGVVVVLTASVVAGFLLMLLAGIGFGIISVNSIRRRRPRR